MAIATREQIMKVLKAWNPWWVTGSVHPDFTKKYRRFAYEEAMRRLDRIGLCRTVILTGVRRVGKTTIQYQMIDTLLKRGVPPQRIVFISLDHPVLKLSEINEILECYHQNVYTGQDCFYFFNEIQCADGWDKWLTSIYDMHPKTQVVATGSACPAMMKDSTESSADRWSVVPVSTLSFYEYCVLTGVDLPELGLEVTPTVFAIMTRRERTAVMQRLSPLQSHLMRYLSVGGFPELALASNDHIIQRIMQEDVISKALKCDLPTLYRVRSSTELERVFLYLCNLSAEIVSVSAIAKTLDGASRPTVDNYIKYLESANLIYLSYPVELGGRKVLKAQPKVYIADAAIRNAVLMDDEWMINPEALEKMVETAVYRHVESLCHRKAARVGYYRDGRRGDEISAVVECLNTKKILVEVRYREHVLVLNNSAIYELCGEADASIVVTKRADDYGVHNVPNGKELVRIPAFAFLYLLGRAEWYSDGL